MPMLEDYFNSSADFFNDLTSSGDSGYSGARARLLVQGLRLILVSGRGVGQLKPIFDFYHFKTSLISARARAVGDSGFLGVCIKGG